MKRLKIAVAVMAIMALTGTIQAENKRPLQVVSKIDFNRYAGKWYEIARLPNRFQKRCVSDVTADYTLRKDGKITVLNRCRLENGEWIKAEGLARTAGKGQPNSVLKVRFAPSFLSFLPQVWGDYQVLSLSPDYEHAVVGDPEREYLWILSRRPNLPDSTYRALVAEADAQGFDVGQLEKTRHSPLPQ